MEEFDLYKKKRTALRTSVTKILKKLEELLTYTEETDVNEVEELLEHLNDKHEALKSVDSKFEKLVNLDDLEKEIETAEDYREKIIAWRFRAGKHLKSINQSTIINPSFTLNTESAASNVRNCETVAIRLPKVTIAKFYGDISQWLTFWNSFETAIHKNMSLDNVDKFNYLKAHLAGTALETVEGFSISSVNYDKAIALLENRFGRKEILINTHMNNLLQIPPLKRSSDIKHFRRLFDKLQIQIRSLESLGIESETFGSLLCPMILKLLPYDLIFEFNKEYDSSKYTVINLIEFLGKQLNAREKTCTSLQKEHTWVKGNDSFKRIFNARDQDKMVFEKKKMPSAAELFSTTEAIKVKPKCVFCEGLHKSSDCVDSRNFTLEERKSILLKRGACFRCLKLNHLSRDCKVKITCTICGKRHVDIMCFAPKDYADINENHKTSEAHENTLLTNHSCSNEVYLQTLRVYVKEKGLKRLIRIIIDTGSQKSYISKFIARKMKLKSLGEETVIHGLFGGIEHTENHQKYRVKLANVDQSYECEFEVMDQAKICASIPKLNDTQYLSELESLGIFVSDVKINEKSCLFEKNPDEIHLLIGADLAGKLFTGKVKRLSEDLVAVHTHLGWTVMGKSITKNTNDSSLLVLSLHVNNAKISDLWNLDTLGIKDASEMRTKFEIQELALKHFKDTVTVDDTGRYKVSLPWLEGHPPLPENKDMAQKRLKSTVKSLKSMNKLKHYQDVFDEWENEGVIERTDSDLDKRDLGNLSTHYLPHRPVFKERSTTKVRPVFDGSAKTRDSVSLNECLEKGPNLIEQIPSILNRFRVGKIGVIADIKKAFLQIGLNESDRNFLRFLWWIDGDPYKEITYRHCRVVFGISSSPFLLAAVLNHVLDNVEEPMKLFAKKLKSSMYVDNCVTSVDSISELDYFRVESQKIFKSAKFDLRGWRSSSNLETEESANEGLNELEDSCVSVLGLTWNLKNDTLFCELTDTENDDEHVTKRRILSLAHRIFDPIGFTCPVTLIPKLLLQECWKIEASWDSKLPENIAIRFQNWKNQLRELQNVKIPRKFSALDLADSDLTFHVFCDASKSSYATCVFLRAEKKGKVTCQLIQARSRVAPLKGLSIPRLELLACTIGARLADSVKKDLHMEKQETFYWSDSMDVLYWIKRENCWNTFVSNRVKEIRSLSSISAWKYIPGVQNPADLPSRGCSVKTLIKGRWWEGPLWLKDEKDTWPDVAIIPNEDTINAEKKKMVVSSINNEKNEYFYHRMSSYKKIIRVTAWLYRFCRNAKNPIAKKLGEISANEFQNAERAVLKNVQKNSFHMEKDTNLKSLPIVIDADGLLRVKTKIFMRDDEENFRLPVVLPSNHHVVKMLIIWKHQQLGHSGVPLLMTVLRENYWILKSRKTIKNAIKTCTICKRFSSKPPEVQEGVLPENRVKNASVFEVIGVDLAGPLILRDNSKAWILILTCAVYRAIHLELLTSISTDNFLLGLRRFISRRGRPTVIYSDNGTNFVGAQNLLKKIDFDKLRSQSNFSSIEWKFIPPTAPWWGGFWERLIGVMKRIMRKVLGRTSLNYEEMSTVLCDCESIINSRPLTYVTDDIEDLNPITPSMFLQEMREIGVPDLDCLDNMKINKRYKYRVKIRQDLRSRFRSEYLGQLRQTSLRGNMSKSLKVGDVVIIWTENSNRITWPLGRIVEIYPSKDGIVRVVKVKTMSGNLIRPVKRICPLEVADTAGFPTGCPTTTPVGRIVRAPS